MSTSPVLDSIQKMARMPAGITITAFELDPDEAQQLRDLLDLDVSVSTLGKDLLLKTVRQMRQELGYARMQGRNVGEWNAEHLARIEQLEAAMRRANVPVPPAPSRNDGQTVAASHSRWEATGEHVRLTPEQRAAKSRILDELAARKITEEHAGMKLHAAGIPADVAEDGLRSVRAYRRGSAIANGLPVAASHGGAGGESPVVAAVDRMFGGQG